MTEPSALAYADDERLAAFYERHMLGECQYQAPLRIAELIERLARPGTRWLELGAGTGLVGKALAARGVKLELVAVDSSSAMLDRLDSAAYVARVRADCRVRLPLDDRSFDGAVACGLLEHIEAPRSLWGELSRLLRPRSPLVFTFPPTDAPGAEARQRDDALVAHDPASVRRELEAAGFTWLFAFELPAYLNGKEGWITYRAVHAEHAPRFC
jgi:predicted TPR repeat methyltransferase